MENSTKDYPRYRHIQIMMHWLSAIAILIIIVLPLTRDFWAPLLGGMGNLFMLHKSFAVLVFILTIARIVINIKLGVPETLPANERLLRAASNGVQKSIYLLLLALPISGFLMSGNGINFFNVATIPVLNLSAEVKSAAHTFHIWGGYVIIALILLHAVAALFHHYIQKDNVLNSMLLRRKG